MRFWDASAIVPLVVAQPSSPSLLRVYAGDRSLVVWWATEVECGSALARLEREGLASQAETLAALDRLASLVATWHEIEPRDAIRRTAIRLLRTHPLRAADALQLAAAIVATQPDPSTLDVVTLDAHLARAADREGFRVVVPG